ncbi:MAG: T9SS type A sorting domain-containing protein [Bacteroidota bacterium]
MTKNLLIILSILFGSIGLKAQSLLYSNTFSTSLGTATAVNGSSGNWVFTNACSQSSATGHSAPGSALFQGSGCTFGNGGSTVSGDLITPTVVLPALGGTLTFNYFILNECGSGSCYYDRLSVAVTNMSTNVTTTIVDSYTGVLVNTSVWTGASFNLSAYGGQPIRVTFNFNSIDGALNNYDGIYVDDINIIGACSINMLAVLGGGTVSPAICAGNSLTLTTNAVSGYSWSNGATTASIVVSPTATSFYSLSATSVSNCVASSAITVTVSGGVPVLSVTTNSNNICLGKTVILTASGANSYSWTNGVVNGVGFTPSVTSNYVVSGTNGCGTSTALTSVTVAPLSVSILANPTVVCSGQQALLTVAAAANSFTWQPINSTVSSNTIFVSPQISTTYSLAAGDGTCIGTATVFIAAKAIPTLNIVASSTLVCQGFPVTLTASGAISYTWGPVTSNSNSVVVNPTAPTLYSVTGSNSLACSAGAFVAIITNPSPTIALNTANNLICTGDAATITASGANSYTWSTGANSSSVVISPSVSSIISVSGTSNNCISTQTVNIDVFTPNIIITGSTSICAGKSATLVASGANTYNWSNGIPSANNIVSPNSTTIYTLSTLTNTSGVNCASSKTVQVTVNPNPTVTALSTRSVMCKSENNIITASGATSYSWNTSATTASFVITPSLVTTMNYSVIGIGANGCQNTATVSIKVNACTGLQELSNGVNSLNIYPNPNNGEFTLSASSAVKLAVINQLGQVIKNIDLNENNGFQNKLSGLSSGIYFVKDLGNEQNNAIKIIVNN